MEGESGRKAELAYEGGHDFWVVLCNTLLVSWGKTSRQRDVPNGTNAFRPFGTSGSLMTGALSEGCAMLMSDIVL